MPALALIAGLVGFLAMPAILVGLIKPHWVMPAAWRPTRGRAALLYLALSIAGVGIAGSMTSPSPETLARQEADASKIGDAARAMQEQANSTPAKPEVSATPAPAPTEDQSQVKVTLYKTEEPSSAGNDATTPRATESPKAEAAKPVPTLNIPFDQAKAKFLPWVKQYKAIGDTGQVMGNNEADAMILLLTPGNGMLAQVEYTGFMEKGNARNADHFMRARRIMDFVAPTAPAKDKDDAVKGMLEDINSGKPIEYDIGTHAKMRATYAPMFGMWTFAVEAIAHPAGEQVKASATQGEERPKAFPTGRATFTAMAKGWGWECRAPAEKRLLMSIGGRGQTVTTEVVYCINPGNNDTFRIHGNLNETYLLAYTGDLLHPRKDAADLAEVRFNEVMKALKADKTAKAVTAAIRKQRQPSQEQSCTVAQDCPTYRDERKEGGIEVEFSASVKRAVDWSLTPIQP